ncbi:MAG: hypothetical protein Q4F17_08265 [Eubacteriales bacterium]|nr:hypothetical protein [Eubacteriales bacterium]
MADTKLKIQKTSRFAYWMLNVLAVLLAVGLVELVVTSLLYGDAYSRNQVEAMEALGPVLERMVSAVPAEKKLQPVLFLCLGLGAVRQVLLVLAVAQLAKVFRSVSRSGTPFALSHVRPLWRVFYLALALFLVDIVKNGFEGPMAAGVAGYRLQISLGWVAALALVECSLSIFRYGCQLQQESDETL